MFSENKNKANTYIKLIFIEIIKTILIYLKSIFLLDIYFSFIYVNYNFNFN